MTSATTPRAYVVFPGAGDQVHALGLTAIEKVRSADTAGVCYAFEVLVPPGFGIPPHVHSREDEILYVIEGEYAIILGTEQFRAGAGSVLNFTRGTAHGFQNVGATTARALHVVTPGTSFEQFLHDLGQVPPGPPDLPRLAALFGKYGMELLPPPGP
ncbi:MAG TPA: cupin domain-containing protein [Chloroflexia bacterium]|nr:cupin domain-containing protein [Chloroflexia bacterium]